MSPCRSRAKKKEGKEKKGGKEGVEGRATLSVLGNRYYGMRESFGGGRTPEGGKRGKKSDSVTDISNNCSLLVTCNENCVLNQLTVR